MTGLSKKLSVLFLAIAAVLCLTLGLLFNVPKTASAAVGDNTLLSAESDFVIEDGELKGLSAGALAEISGKNFDIAVPAGVTKISAGTADAVNPSILSSNISRLKNLSIPASVTEIGEYAFYGCTAISEIDLTGATGLKTIGANAFNSGVTGGNRSGGALTNLTIPENVTSIGNLAFASHTGLTVINFFATDCGDFAGENNNPFYKAAYNSNAGLTVNIGKAAQGSDDGITVHKIPANMFYSSSQYLHKVTAVNFANVDTTVEGGSFGANAFRRSQSLSSVTFGSNVKINEIGAAAFQSCTQLSTVTLPASVKSIGTDAFNSCTSIVNVYLADGSVLETIGDNAFMSSGVSIISTMPATLKTIGKNAFSSCQRLQAFAFASDESLTTVGGGAFNGCVALKKVYVGTTEPAENVISLPKSVTAIGESAFTGCVGFEKIIVPVNVTTIGNSAFSKCTGVNEIEYYAKAGQSANTISPFTGGGNNITLTIGGGNAQDTITSLSTNLFAFTGISKVTFNNISLTSTAALGNGLFTGCTQLTEVEFGSLCSINQISADMFNGCTLLSEINLNAVQNLKTISTMAFYDCPSLYTVTIPSTVETIDPNAFGGKTRILEVVNLSTLDIKAGDTAQVNGGIGYYALSVVSSKEASNIKEENDFIFLTSSNNSSIALVRYVGQESEIELPEYNGSHVYSIRAQAFMGNTVITEVTIPSGITEIGASAFRDCTALEKVTFPDNISTINDYVFSGCTSLKSFTVPDSVTKIDNYAFKDCTSLASVEFNENSGLTSIGTSAFENCSSLVVFNSPAKLGSGSGGIGGRAFMGCTSLTTFYLPEPFAVGTSSIFDANSNLVLIAPDKTAYNNYRTNFGSYKLTYIVEISLINVDEKNVPDTENTGVAYKLFNLDSRYEKDSETGAWVINLNSNILQEGYSSSVWYEEASCENKVGELELNTLLEKTDWDAKLYAYKLEIPKLTAKSGLIYKGESANGYTVNSVFEEAISEKYTLTIIEFYLHSGTKQPVPTDNTLLNAGRYLISVSIADKETYGQWAENDLRIFEVVIERASQNISIENIYWGLSSGDKLMPYGTGVEPKNLYLYQGDVPYEKEQDVGMGTPTIVPVVESYVVASGEEVTIKLFNNSNITTFEIGNYAGNSYTAAGKYTATVILIPGNNYGLSFTNDENALRRGESLTQNADSTYTFTKVWYIVNSGSGQLLNESNTTYGDVTKGWNWTYQKDENAIPGTPKYVSDEEASFILTFSLSFNTVETAPVVTRESISNFGNVINSSMPAGSYILTIHVNQEDSNNSWDYIYPITVNSASLIDILTANKLSGNADSWMNGDKQLNLQSQTFSVKDDGSMHLNSGNVKLLIEGLNESQIHTRKGIWSDSKYDAYFGVVTVSYNIVKSNDTSGNTNRNYFTEQQLKNQLANPPKPGESVATSVIPNSMGRYTIYYNIEANSFRPLADTDAAKAQYRYTLIIYGELALPTIPSMVYTGSNLTFTYQSDFFEVVPLDGLSSASRDAINATQSGTYTYVNTGTYKVALKIRASYYDGDYRVCQWVSPYSDSQYALVNVTITPATNVTTTALFVKSWEWGHFNETENYPTWGTRYPANYTYTILNEDTRIVYSFSQNSSFRYVSEAPAGNYELTATAIDPNGNVTNCVQSIKISIAKATLYWETTPYIESWRYGELATRFVEPTFKLPEVYAEVANSINSYYCLVSDLGTNNVYANLQLLAEAYGGEVPAGSYVLVYELLGDSNYNAWSYPVYFSVLKAENYWTLTPNVHDWLYGEFSDRITEPAAVPRFGSADNVMYTYVPIDPETQAPIGQPVNALADLRDENGEIPVGTYRLVANLVGGVNYEAMKETVVEFTVNKSVNSWTVIPTIISWSEGRYKAETNFPQATPKFGTVYYYILDEQGNRYELTRMKSLDVGSYKLVAEVAGTDNYEALTATTSFAVFEDSLSINGIIAATVVFAVIAVGLAVCGVVFLIRRNKKIEEDFRKMVKSELKRR